MEKQLLPEDHKIIKQEWENLALLDHDRKILRWLLKYNSWCIDIRCVYDAWSDNSEDLNLNE